MLKATGIPILLVLAITIAGCGSSSVSGLISGNINGTWTATLNNTDGSIAYQFSATFTQGTGSGLSVTNVTFTIPGPCMSSGEPGTGSFTPANGTFGMSMASPDVGGPTMNLQGILSNGTISGTWRASEVLQPCGGNGTFTMQRSMAG